MIFLTSVQWKQRTPYLLACGLALALATLACTRPERVATPSTPAPTATAAQSVVVPGQQTTVAQVDIKLFVYSPTPLHVAAGTTVTWLNQDGIEHSVTHGSKDQPGSAFDSGLFFEGQTYAHTFTESGIFSYFCTRHPHMQGEISVG